MLKNIGIGAHRDFGCITLLMQDNVGGLQVLDKCTGEWLDVKPVPGAYVVNLGNLMMRWTNHKYTSNLHRVMNFSRNERYSIPYFFTGNPNFEFDCIPGCEGKSEWKTLKKMTVKDFLKEQFDTSYSRVET
jgi:isopenicillin N synthase-like dioxygenase